MSDRRNAVKVEVLGREAGSGYYLGGGLVLTAAHAVPDDRAAAVAIRFPDSDEPIEGRPVWRSDDLSLDAALVQLAGPVTESSRRFIKWGLLQETGPAVPCEVVGYRRTRSPGRALQMEHLYGTVTPQTDPGSGLLAISIADGPKPIDDRSSALTGMSGAAVWCNDHLVGIAVQEPTEYRSRRLLAIPVTRLLADRQFSDWITKAVGQTPTVEIVNPGADGGASGVRWQGSFDVFLSYTNADIAFARIADIHLSRAGLAVFFAERIIRHGDDVEQAITDALARSKAFVVIVGTSLSEGSWAAFELVQMRDRVARENALLIPVYIGDARVPEYLAPFPGVDLRGETDDATIAQRLSELAARLRAASSPSGGAGGSSTATSADGPGTGSSTSDGHDIAGIGIWGFGDRPAERDLLQRAAIIEALGAMLAHQRASAGARTGIDSAADPELLGPTVVALEGPWGSGKTTLMEHVERQLKASPNGSCGTEAPRRLRAWRADLALSGQSRFNPVWDGSMLRRAEPGQGPSLLTVRFEPWTHQTGEQIWAGLANSLLEAAKGIVGSNRNARERYWFHRNAQRLDVQELQRALRRRTISPLFRVAVFALIVPVVSQLARATDTDYTLGDFAIAGVNLALLVPTLLLAAGIVHTVVRLFRPVANVLPTELFTQPVLSSTLSLAATQKADTPLRDPYYKASSGYLYLVQHDVFDVLKDVVDAGHELVVFIDDLDRCGAKATASVFEAINLFLTKQFPTTRFVIGLDASAVAAHLDDTYSSMADNDHIRHAFDPTVGWSYLRKLIQLQIPVPAIAKDLIPSVLDGLLGSVDAAATANGSFSSPPPSGSAEPASPVDSPAEVTPTAPPPGVPRIVRTLELDADVRKRLTERIDGLPQLSIREAKRVLTTWQFYVHVSELLEPRSGPEAVDRARHLVILAEILSRWPALQRSVLQRTDGEHGLSLLARSVDDDIAWAKAVDRLGLGGTVHKGSCRALRDLLRDYDGTTVAVLAARLT